MQWCKLYSKESKYNLTIQTSTIAKQVPYYLAGLIFIVCFIILAHFGLHLSYENIFLCSAATAFSTLGLYRQLTPNTLASNAFLISEDGILVFAADNKYVMTKGCHVFSFGCALCLIEIKPIKLNQHEENKPLNMFIFKDELNNEDYRRLCRIILRYKTTTAQG